MKNLPKILTTIILITVLSIFANAQTNVSGFISANTTWNLAGNPYIVIGNALLSHGYTLTIEPGVIVKFETDKALQIDGELIAIGTPQNRITFTSNQVSPAAGDWAKIHFPDTCVDATFDATGNYLSGSIMKYCDVLYGGGIGFGEIHIESSSPYISHCTISNSAADGINCFGSTYLLDSSVVQDCLGVGISFDFFTQHSCGLVIKGDTIRNNSQGGIYLGTQGTPTCSTEIRNNYFFMNDQNGAINAPTSSILSNITISENYFIQNSAQISGGIIHFANVRNDIINCNKFVNNQNGSVIDIEYPADGIIINNVFDGNINSTGNVVFNIVHGNQYPLYFSNNTVSNNSSPGHPCFYLSAQYFQNNQLIHFDHNQLSNNTGTSIIKISGLQISNSTYNFLLMKFNNFVNSNAQFEVYNDIPYGSPNIYADSNYWGSTNIQHIDSVIYDYFDFANQSVVYYSPILTSPAAIDTTCPVGIPTFVSNIESTTSTVLLFPNPTATKFYLNAFAFNTEKNLSITLTNMQGKIILQQEFDKTKAVDVSSLPNGIYVVEVRGHENVVRGKVVVQH